MTIVAGFFGPNYGVLAADSEEGGGLSKSSVRKIATIDRPEFKALIGGAGNGDFIDLSVQQADDRLKGVLTHKQIRDELDQIVRSMYKDRIESFPREDHEYLDFSLLCAIWVKSARPLVELVRVNRAGALVRPAADVIGSAMHLTRYLQSTMGKDSLNVLEAARLATYVVSQAKKFVNGCGGSTQVVAVGGDDGKIITLEPALIAQHELIFTYLVEKVAKLIFYETDPTGGLDVEKLKTNIEAGMARIGQEMQRDFLQSIPKVKQPQSEVSSAARVVASTAEPKKIRGGTT